MAWTIGTTAEHADTTAQRPRSALLRILFIAAMLTLAVLALLGHSWAAATMLLLAGTHFLGVAAAGFRAARPPADGPCFAIASLREGPAEVVGRVLPPERGLLSPLTSTKCSFYDYCVEVLDERTGERKVVDQGTKLTNFWLKDVTGSILVETEGIDIRVKPQLDEDLRKYDQTPRAVGERLQKLEIDPFVTPGVRRAILFRETRLDPGDNMLVKGHVTRADDGTLVIRRAPAPVPAPASASAPTAGSLSVERWSSATFVPAVPASARRALWIGALLLVAGAAWLALRISDSGAA